jgi:hypothetical protein
MKAEQTTIFRDSEGKAHETRVEAADANLLASLKKIDRSKCFAGKTTSSIDMAILGHGIMKNFSELEGLLTDYLRDRSDEVNVNSEKKDDQ